MTMKMNIRFAVITFGLVLGQTAFSDVLLIEPVRQIEGMDAPVNGMTMDEVEGRFGAPESTDPAVGDPPITRWDYERWSVFFEYSTVLYSVLHEGEVLGGQSSADESDGNDSQ